MSVNPYLWIAIVGGIIAFLMGCGVGMNDLANSFGTTYGARILKLWQICILASICEFAGAVSLGGAVTSTISGGIADPMNFKDQPYVFMYGMLCAGGAAFLWLVIATYFVLPVSSTHSVCGGVIGFGLVYGGGGGVKWASRQDDFPFVGGVAPIIASWFISPVLTGIVSAIIYGLVRFLVLRPANAVNRAIYSLPIVVSVAFFLESFFVLYKGASKRLKWSVDKAAWVAACIGAAAGLLSCLLIPLLFRRLRRIKADRDAAEAAAAEDAQAGRAAGGSDSGDTSSAVMEEFYYAEGSTGSARKVNEPMEAADCGADVRKETEADGRVVGDDDGENPLGSRTRREPGAAGSEGGEPVSDADNDDDSSSVVFTATETKGTDNGTASGLTVDIYHSDAEYVYRFLQIFTAICASFAHGASDVSNAVGPFAAIYEVYQTQSVESIAKMNAPIWILCIGGAGLVVGLSTFGIRLMRLLGEKLTVITPSRGFSAELAAALVVSFASGYGIPVSSTHCITGAVIAISIVDVGFRKVRWLMVLKMYAGWIFTLVITAFFSALFFSQGVFAPIA